MVEHRSIDYQYGNVIFHLRLVQLVALPIQMLALSMEVEK